MTVVQLRAAITHAEQSLASALALSYEEDADREERTFQVRLAIREHLALWKKWDSITVGEDA